MPIYEVDVASEEGGFVINDRTGVSYTTYLDGPGTSVSAPLGFYDYTRYQYDGSRRLGYRLVLAPDTSIVPANEVVTQVDVELNFSAATTNTRLVAMISADTNLVDASNPPTTSNWDTRAEKAVSTVIGEFSASGLTGFRRLDTLNHLAGAAPGVNRSGPTHIHFMLGYEYDEADPGIVAMDSYTAGYHGPDAATQWAKLIITTDKPAGMMGDVF